MVLLKVSIIVSDISMLDIFGAKFEKSADFEPNE